MTEYKDSKLSNAEITQKIEENIEFTGGITQNTLKKYYDKSYCLFIK